jgi:CheY-like chemotaxis protein
MPAPEYILIAEDDHDDQLLISSAFMDIGERTPIRFVENGIELVDHFRKFELGTESLPLLAIIDLNMPRKNGREAMAELRGKSYFRHFPSVVFSTTGNEFERRRCLELGFQHYFVKPANYTLLLEMARQFSALAQSARVI